MNEVEKVLSAPELLILQFVHGPDAIINVEKCKKQKVSSNEEKDRLKGLYDVALKRRKQSVDSIFGPLGALPVELPDELNDYYDLDSDEEIDDEDIIAAAKKATRRGKKKQNPEQAKNKKEAERLEQVLSEEQVSIDELVE